MLYQHEMDICTHVLPAQLVNIDVGGCLAFCVVHCSTFHLG
jgi:uncharacterized membrane protein